MRGKITCERQIICKSIILLGESHVGKTSILQRYTKEKFSESYTQTIGVDYFSKDLEYDQIRLILSLWDTSGYEYDTQILPTSIYKFSSSFILICSYDNRKSFEMIPPYLDLLQKHLTFSLDKELVPVVLLINKSDITQDRKFQINELITLIDEYNLNIWLYEVSALKNIAIDYVFEKITAAIFKQSCVSTERSRTRTYSDDTSTIESFNLQRKKSFQMTYPEMKRQGQTLLSCK